MRVSDPEASRNPKDYPFFSEAAVEGNRRGAFCLSVV
jgi:hypothetical protein